MRPRRAWVTFSCTRCGVTIGLRDGNLADLVLAVEQLHGEECKS